MLGLRGPPRATPWGHRSHRCHVSICLVPGPSCVTGEGASGWLNPWETGSSFPRENHPEGEANLPPQRNLSPSWSQFWPVLPLGDPKATSLSTFHCMTPPGGASPSCCGTVTGGSSSPCAQGHQEMLAVPRGGSGDVPTVGLWAPVTQREGTKGCSGTSHSKASARRVVNK